MLSVYVGLWFHLTLLKCSSAVQAVGSLLGVFQMFQSKKKRWTHHTLNKRHIGDVAEMTVGMLANLSVLQLALGRLSQFNWA